MEYRIRAYVDELFESAPRTQRAYELKIELTQNLIDKYYALVSEGKSEQCGFFHKNHWILFLLSKKGPTKTRRASVDVDSPASL